MNRPLRDFLGAALQLALVTVLATALVAGVHALTRERIADREHDVRMQELSRVLPADAHDNDAVADAVRVDAPSWLGRKDVTVHRGMLRGEPSALVLQAVAPDGYAGPIHLLIAVDRGGAALGVRIVSHRETPGLGDGIEGEWSTRFAGRSLGDPVPDRWAVRRDGGDFDQLAGATVTPRAVVRAVRRSLEFVARHGDELRAAPAGATLRFDTAPAGDVLP